MNLRFDVWEQNGVHFEQAIHFVSKTGSSRGIHKTHACFYRLGCLLRRSVFISQVSRSIETTNKQTSKQQTLQTLMTQPVETALHKIIRE